jgi:PRTRC genetic system protein E
MTIFRELYALATSATLTMIVSADEKTGKLTISVLPKPRKDVGEPALTKDLTLTASPEDFDAEFVQALQGYRETRASLTEQAEVTRKVLEAAKSVSAKKASEAMAKASKVASAVKPAPTITAAESGADQNEDEPAADTANQQTATPAPGESLALFG